MNKLANAAPAGFALPSVLIASIVMMIVLMTALVATSGVRVQLDQQFYAQQARQAAESGAVFAEGCLRDNEYDPPWASGTLVTGQNCNRTNNMFAPNYIVSTPNYRSYYRVAAMAPGENVLRSEGVVETLRTGTGAVWQTHTYTLAARISSELAAERIGFAYRWEGTDNPATGVFFGAIARNSEVYSLGNNAIGQLGDGTTINRLTPVRYQLPPNVGARRVLTNFVSVGLGMYVITTDGELYAAGANPTGQLTGTTNPVSTPLKINFPGVPTGSGQPVDVIGVENIVGATFVSLSNGDLFASGDCAMGKLGTGPSCVNRNVMTRVALPAGQLATEYIIADASTAYVITAAGHVYGWGANQYGQLGTTVPIGGSTSTPVRIGTFGNTTALRAKSLSFDGRTLYVVTEGGQLYAIGDNEHRQILNSSTTRYNTPQLMNVAAAGCTGQVIDARTDRSHVAVLTSSGHVCTAGYNATGQLGRGTLSDMPLGRVTLPIGVTAQAIWVNSLYTGNFSRTNNTFIVGSNGAVYGAGANFYGQLGRGNYLSSATFVPMNVFGSGVNRPRAKSVQSGLGTTVIFTTTGLVYTVGHNNSGQLGDGTTNNNPHPRATRYVNVGSSSYF